MKAKELEERLEFLMIGSNFPPKKDEQKLKHIMELVNDFSKAQLIEFDWKKLREKYFNECVGQRTVKDEKGQLIDTHTWIDFAPHDLFEWFKKELVEQFLKEDT